VLPFDAVADVEFEFTIGNTKHPLFMSQADFQAGNLYRLHFVLNFNSATLINTNIIPRKEVYEEREIDIEPIPPTSIELNETAIVLPPNGTKTLTATVLPHYSAQGVMWESDDIAVATVDKNGKVTAKGIGTAPITATTAIGGLMEMCKVRVVDGVEIDGIIWATRNVDAPGTFAANPEDAGMFFRWGNNRGWRNSDPIAWWTGSEWNTTSNQWRDSASAPLYGEGKDVTWNNNVGPCPDGWRLPEEAELTTLFNHATNNGVELTAPWLTAVDSGFGVTGWVIQGVGDDVLFLPAAGSRPTPTGALNLVGLIGRYWSSTQSGTNHAMYLWFSSNSSDMRPLVRADGLPVRCVAK
jgi:uncharacterized protein (TIGR02145 family)